LLGTLGQKPVAGRLAKPKEIEAHDQRWSFLPVILGAAAACLLLYFFLTPGFNAEAERSAAKSARPGATTQTALPPATKP
jgi:hypothetical protein